MVDPLSLAASVYTLGDGLKTLLEFAADFRDASDDLKRYGKVLASIKRAVALMVFLLRQTELDKKLSGLSSGNGHNIIDTLVKNVHSIVQDLERFLRSLSRAKDCRDSQANGLERLYERVKTLLSRGKVVVYRDHINHLIQAAKYVESSLQCVFTTILLVNSNIRSNDAIEIMQGYSDTVLKQSRVIEGLRKDYQSEKSRVVSVKKAITRQSLSSLTSRRLTSRTKKPKQDKTPVKDQCNAVQSGPVSNFSNDNISTSSLINIDAQDQQALTSDFTILGDGTEVKIQESASDVDSASMTLPPEPRTENTASDATAEETIICNLETNATAADQETINDNESEDWSSPESEAFDLEPTTLAESACYVDGFDLEVKRKAILYLDESITLANCVSPNDDSETLSFCVETCIIQECGVSMLILRQRCDFLKVSRSCAHVVVDSYSKLPSDHQLPCLIQSTLRQSTSEPHADTYDAEESFLRLIVCHGFDTRCRYTKIVSHSEKCELVATKTHLVAAFATEATANSRKESEEKAGQSNGKGEHDAGQSPSAENDSTTAPPSDVTSDLEPKTEGDPTIQSLNAAREPADGPKGGNIYRDIDLTCFSQLPCFLCQQDALDPEVSGKAWTPWFLTESHSIAYTCQRCNDRTWISRYTRGLLPAVGGRWSLTGPRWS